MYAVVLLGFLALASAAPHFGVHHDDHYERYPHSFESELDGYLRENIFDTKRFWNDLQREMLAVNNMIEDLNKHFPSSVSSEKIEGDKYIITISLTGYKVNEIAVKAKKGLLVIQAVHKIDGQSERNYLDVRTLPDFANEAGSWSFVDGILKITFPLGKGDKTNTVVSTTNVPQHSREKLEPHEDNIKPTYDDNVAETFDNNQKVNTNKNIPKYTPVEATTYAVDLKGEVELLPAQY